jgi:hypothetical protein
MLHSNPRRTTEMTNVVPFPLAQRNRWIADLIDAGARLGLYDASALFTRRIREEKDRLRALGMPEDVVKAAVASVSELLKNEIRERTAKLNKGYTLRCEREDFPGYKGERLEYSAY